MIGVQLFPVDTLFVRDGTPFASDGASQADVGGIFPPSPETISGAMRAALAKCNGWNDRSRRWPSDLNPVLGDGPDDLGSLTFAGPLILKDGVPAIPIPRHVLGTKENGLWHPAALLGPGSSIACDLGDNIPLPEVVVNPNAIEVSKLRDPSGWWMTIDALPAVLSGDLPPGSIFSQDTLWRVERRIGLARDPDRRTAVEGQLYSARHVRTEHNVSIGVIVSGVPDGWRFPFEHLIPLGGEGRVVECKRWDPGSIIPSRKFIRNAVASGRFMVVALTPLILDDAICRGLVPITELGNAKVVSACLDRVTRIGGWSTLRGRPSPMRSVLPAGSVLFCEVDRISESDIDHWLDGGLPRIGRRTAHGYGVVTIGIWPNR